MPQARIRRRALKPPAIRFPGGHVQMVNPLHPIKGVWSDVLYLKPKGELPAHIHRHTSSLLICVGGRGIISVDGRRTRLRKGVCAFIPKGSEHYVKAGRTFPLTCLSINEGIIRPGSRTDFGATESHPAGTADTWRKFIADCAKTAGVFQEKLKRGKSNWDVFTLNI